MRTLWRRINSWWHSYVFLHEQQDSWVPRAFDPDMKGMQTKCACGKRWVW